MTKTPPPRPERPEPRPSVGRPDIATLTSPLAAELAGALVLALAVGCLVGILAFCVWLVVT